MKFNKFAWDNYLQTERGKSVIDDFSFSEMSVDFIIETTQKYNKSVLRRIVDYNQFYEEADNALRAYWNLALCYFASPENLEDAKGSYWQILADGLVDGDRVVLDKNSFAICLENNCWISWLLYHYSSDYFFPNLFQFQASLLYRIADTFGIELPTLPKKSNYQARCMYYWGLCEVFYKFRVENNLSPAELCAFLYDYAPNYLHEEKREMPKPSQAWFIGGVILPSEANDETFWQCNQETRRGDILVHYETSPVSAITCVWQASTDGLIDPFFHYYGCAYMTNKIDVPHITLQELKEDSYFSSHPLVRKNLQGVNGWSMTGEDYANLLRLFEDKGCDVDSLPRPYAPQIKHRDDIKVERDVEVKLLEPLLNEMGFADYKRQVSVKAGRGHRIIADYALHYNETSEGKSARVLIEAKFHIRNPQDAGEAFLQARSYAKLLDASVIVLCDKDCLLVYEKKQDFDRQRYMKFYWGEMSSPDKYQQLKKILQ